MDRRQPATAIDDPAALDTLERLERWARLLDSAGRIPGTRIRFGLDSLFGLVPGIGDVVSGGLSSWIIYHGYRLGLPRWTLLRMLGNVGLDTVLGAIPVLGDVFDLFWKANHRNLRLLRRHIEGRRGSGFR